MHGGSPSAVASPATQATNVSWTSAGSTAATGAPALPLPPVRPSVLLPRRLLAPQRQPLTSPACGFCGSPAPAPSCSPSAAPPARSPQPQGPAPLLHAFPALVPCSGDSAWAGHGPAHTSSPARHAHVPLPHRLHGPQMHPAGVCGLLCQQQHLHRQPGQPAPVPMPTWLPG